jgi:bifunctional DNA-binding transcriptional regulator/antitoxin component of YhaV-PrlF toxin-antitoxin module
LDSHEVSRLADASGKIWALPPPGIGGPLDSSNRLAIVKMKREILAITMTVVLKSNTELVVPRSVRRQAGIKAGDQLEFKASQGTITINAVVEPPTYKATKAELAAIRKGEAEIARGEYVTLTNLLHGLDHPRRKSGTKTANKVSR